MRTTARLSGATATVPLLRTAAARACWAAVQPTTVRRPRKKGVDAENQPGAREPADQAQGVDVVARSARMEAEDVVEALPSEPHDDRVVGADERWRRWVDCVWVAWVSKKMHVAD